MTTTTTTTTNTTVFDFTNEFKQIENLIAILTDKNEMNIKNLQKQFYTNKIELFKYFDNSINGRIKKQIILENNDTIFDIIRLVRDNIENQRNEINTFNLRCTTELIRQYLIQFNRNEIANNKTENEYTFEIKEGVFKKYCKGSKISKIFNEGFYRIELLLKTDYITIEDNRIKEIFDFCNIFLSKVIQTIKPYKATLVLSINPIDIMFQSIHTTNWASCHNFLDGCYRSGTLSYISDNNTCIAYVYTKKENYTLRNLTIENLPIKLFRSMIYIDTNTNTILTGKHYPSQNNEIEKELNNLLCDILTNVTNEKSNIYKEAEINYDYESLHYCYADNIKKIISSLKDNNDVYAKIKIGKGYFCPCCGEFRYTEEEPNELLCNRCNNVENCCNCGEYHDSDYMTMINGELYCDSCRNDLFVWCNDCCEYEKQNNCTYLEIYNKYVCEYCLDDNYKYCDDCHEYYNINRVDFTEIITGDIVCSDCLENYDFCNDCGEYYKNDCNC